MIKNKKTVIICIVAAIVLGAVGAGVGIYLHRQKEPEEPAVKYIFTFDDMDSNPVLGITLQKGPEVHSYSSENDIAWFLSQLQALTYTEALPAGNDPGWTYRLIIDRMYGDTDCIVSKNSVWRYNEKGKRTYYRLSEESLPIMQEIISLMPKW
jgi:hypothetical protein